MTKHHNDERVELLETENSKLRKAYVDLVKRYNLLTIPEKFKCKKAPVQITGKVVAGCLLLFVALCVLPD